MLTIEQYDELDKALLALFNECVRFKIMLRDQTGVDISTDSPHTDSMAGIMKDTIQKMVDETQFMLDLLHRQQVFLDPYLSVQGRNLTADARAYVNTPEDITARIEQLVADCLVKPSEGRNAD